MTVFGEYQEGFLRKESLGKTGSAFPMAYGTLVFISPVRARKWDRLFSVWQMGIHKENPFYADSSLASLDRILARMGGKNYVFYVTEMEEGAYFSMIFHGRFKGIWSNIRALYWEWTWK